MSMLDTLRLVLAPPHRAGTSFIVAGGAVAFAGLFVHPAIVWAGLIFTAFCLYFFRDPARVRSPLPGALVAPADGKITSIMLAVPPAELGLGDTPRWRIAIFLSVLNVHVNRMPADAVVTRIAYRPGRFFNASLDKASDENERNAIALRLPNGADLAVVQIGGLIARRILCDVRDGDSVIGGARFGIIRFGSRTDLYLPIGVTPVVSVGQTAVGGETVFALMPA
jgi:phosphatidylserine decarboxylase